MIDVLAPGALSVIQDIGRRGLGALGVAPSGPFDPWSMRAANLLAGNDEAAVLEITVHGPTLRFEDDAVVALAGSRFDAEIDGEPMPHATAVRIVRRSTVTIGPMRDGARAYLAVRGGLDVSRVLGSRATHVAANLGPPRLRAGDRLGIGSCVDTPLRRMGVAARSGIVRALAGPQSERFDPGFFGPAFTVTTRADRTGVRLDGPTVRARESGEIDPQALLFGAVQVPYDGAPIVLGPDRPITGGYPVVAVVIEADIGEIAHARPGDTLRFVECTVDEARAARDGRERALLDAIEDL